MNRMLQIMLITIASVLILGLLMAGCSPSPTPQPANGGNLPTYRLEVDLLGETNEFLVDSQGALKSKLEVSSADGRISLSINKGTVVLDKGGEPLQGIEAVTDPSPPTPPKDAHIVSLIYSLEPQGATFDPWLTITLRYQPDKLPEGVKEKELYIGHHDGADWSVPSYRKVDTEAHSVTTQVYHFTSFAILAPKETAPPETPATGTRAGNLAPDFQFTDLDEKVVSLSDMRGSPVVLNFWSTQCPPCVMEMPLIQQIYNEHSDEGLVVLAINVCDSPSRVGKFMQGGQFSFPVLLDATAKIVQKYNIVYFPTTFFIDKDGIIRHVKPGAFLNMKELESSLSKIMP